MKNKKSLILPIIFALAVLGAIFPQVVGFLLGAALVLIVPLALLGIVLFMCAALIK